MLSKELSEKLKFLADSANIGDDEFLSVLSTVKSIIVANATANSKGKSAKNKRSQLLRAVSTYM